MYRFWIVGLALIVLAACSGDEGAELDVGEGPLVYVAMGNSLTFSPSNAQLNVLYKEMLVEDFGVDVDLRNRTVGGQSTANFLSRLSNDERLRSDLAEADVITFVIPNDEWAEPSSTAVGLPGHNAADCGGDDNQQCLRDMITEYNLMVDQIFEELVTIVDPATQVVRVQDFYLFHTEIPLEQSQILYPYWHQGQIHVQEVAESYGIPVARVWDDFMGTDGEIPNLTEAGLVSADGIHPTATGAQRMAELYHDLGYSLSS